jgi:hypothetical protein
LITGLLSALAIFVAVAEGSGPLFLFVASEVRIAFNAESMPVPPFACSGNAATTREPPVEPDEGVGRTAKEATAAAEELTEAASLEASREASTEASTAAAGERKEAASLEDLREASTEATAAAEELTEAASLEALREASTEASTAAEELTEPRPHKTNDTTPTQNK